MMQSKRWMAVLLCLAALMSSTVSRSFSQETEAQSLASHVAADHDYVFELYKDFHANPELSFKEKRSSGIIARELESLGFAVTTGVGSEWTRAKAEIATGRVLEDIDGYGVVAVFENGPGPTVLIRADMDALPLEEKTGLPYASKVVSTDYRGVEAPVMHACGHDAHMAALIGTARQLVRTKESWSGTLVMIAQPAEEIVLGALAMLNDGLFERFPRPDYNLSLHVFNFAPAGSVAYTPGYAMAAVDTVDIRVRGVGGHGAIPHRAKDPVVIGAQIVTALQTLVSREVDPQDSGVITVGAFNAGYKHNIISDAAHLQLTVRSYTDETRQILREGIKRIAAAQAMSAGLVDEMLPEVTFDPDPVIATYNNPQLVERAMTAIRAELGEDRVFEAPPTMTGEDFAYYGRQDPVIPSMIFWLGAADPEVYEAFMAGDGPAPPGNHSPQFAPVPEPTLKTGVRAMTAAALDLFDDAAAGAEAPSVVPTLQ